MKLPTTHKELNTLKSNAEHNDRMLNEIDDQMEEIVSCIDYGTTWIKLSVKAPTELIKKYANYQEDIEAAVEVCLDEIRTILDKV